MVELVLTDRDSLQKEVTEHVLSIWPDALISKDNREAHTCLYGVPDIPFIMGSSIIINGLKSETFEE